MMELKYPPGGKWSRIDDEQYELIDTNLDQFTFTIYGKWAVSKRTRLGLDPIREGNDWVHVFNGINKHTAELMEDRADKSFD